MGLGNYLIGIVQSEPLTGIFIWKELFFFIASLFHTGSVHKARINHMARITSDSATGDRLCRSHAEVRADNNTIFINESREKVYSCNTEPKFVWGK